MKEYLVEISRIDTGEIIDESEVVFKNNNDLNDFMEYELHNYDDYKYSDLEWFVRYEKGVCMMKYTISYSMPNDIHHYMMHAKDEEQLVTFLKMLTDEQAYGIEVVPENTAR